jgi:ubiquinone/menaquinone biosynthesis C-methylase UbiE
VTGPLVELRLSHQRKRAEELERRLVTLLGPLGRDQRVLDAGCGTGALACALAPHVAEVVGVDASPLAIEGARTAAPGNCTFEVGDATALRFAGREFSLAGCLRVLHHVDRPDRVVSELARVTRVGGVVLVVDQLGSVDAGQAAASHAFERARDPSHERLLTDDEIRAMLETNELVVTNAELTRESRKLEPYLDLVGLEGEKREHARSLAPGPEFEVDVGWYVARSSRS